MAPLTCVSKSPDRRRIGWIGAGIVAAILLWHGSALAINALVSQDLPLLTQIAATELGSYAQLGSILGEAAAIVAEVKEYTSIAKTAWGAVNELRTLTWDQVKESVESGLNAAYPEVSRIYGDVKDIKNLDYRDPRALTTLRGMLWEEVYGPAIDYLHTGHENLDTIAEMEEHRARQLAKLAARREQLEAWEEDCRRTSTGDDAAEGACQGAANRASIQQALLLTELHETSLHVLTAQERAIERADRKEMDDLYVFQRWMSDVENLMAASAGVKDRCPAGECLYQQYGQGMARRIAEYRARHPKDFELTIRRKSDDEEE